MLQNLTLMFMFHLSAIGDLDDFGNLPSISDKDIERFRKNKMSHV